MPSSEETESTEKLEVSPLFSSAMEKNLDMLKDAEGEEECWPPGVRMPLDAISEGGYNINERHKVVLAVGEGSFGRVVVSTDYLLGRFVAVKVSKDEKEAVLYQECETLMALNRTNPNSTLHNIVQFFDGYYHRGRCIMLCEYLEMSLRQYLHLFGERIMNYRRKGLRLAITREVAFQVLEGLEFLAKNGLVHTDIKTDNIMFKRYDECAVKIVDLGGAKRIRELAANAYRIQTRPYRAIEVLLGLTCNEKVDIWSLGCVIAEMHMGQLLFSSDCEESQLESNYKLLGKPPLHMLERSTKPFVVAFKKDASEYDIEYAKYANYVGGPRINAPASIISMLSKERFRFGFPSVQKAEELKEEGQLMELVTQMLTYDPDSRISIADIFQHPFFNFMSRTT